MSSSRFVSGGTTDAPTARDEEWRLAQANLDAKQAARLEASQRQQTGKSLYETLQANKAAKQEAFEESLKLRHQFQNLDEDDVEFLEAVREAARREQQDEKRELKERLDEFRRRQEEVEKATATSPGAGEGSVTAIKGVDPAVRRSSNENASQTVNEAWSINHRKRKKGVEKSLVGVKLRRTSAAGDKETELGAPPDVNIHVEKQQRDEERITRAPISSTAVSASTPAAVNADAVSTTPPLKSSKASLLGLTAYSSDEDD